MDQSSTVTPEVLIATPPPSGAGPRKGRGRGLGAEVDERGKQADPGREINRKNRYTNGCRAPIVP